VTDAIATAPAPVPFLDLGAMHAGLKEEILEDVAALVDSSAFTNGPAVAEFERAFADWCGTAGCVGLASGLDALRLGLIALGLEAGDEVLVPANTFVATFEAVTQAGGRPVPVDVTELDYNLDVDAAAAAVSERTRVLLPVHLYGQLADLRAVAALAGRAGLEVLEDACQAHGAERDGVRPGASFPAAFSFYPGKNLGAFGDAGALTLPDDRLVAPMRALREHGQYAKYRHEIEGWTARLDTIQAHVLLRKLPHLERWNAERRHAARLYGQALAGLGDLRLPPVPEGSDPVWHLYEVRTADPDGLGDFLRERGVGTGRHYPQPAHLSNAYGWLGYGEGSFPVTEALARELLSLPIFPGMTEAQVERVAGSIAEYFARGR
jgi:dTDP-4-amino-4,6-dideoxygalactose transaminase